MNAFYPEACRPNFSKKSGGEEKPHWHLNLAPKRIQVAAGTSTIQPGATANVSLKLTKRGKRVRRMVKRSRIKGVLEIRNTFGTLISNTPVKIRIRRR